MYLNIKHRMLHVFVWVNAYEDLVTNVFYIFKHPHRLCNTLILATTNCYFFGSFAPSIFYWLATYSKQSNTLKMAIYAASFIFHRQSRNSLKFQTSVPSGQNLFRSVWIIQLHSALIFQCK